MVVVIEVSIREAIGREGGEELEFPGRGRLDDVMICNGGGGCFWPWSTAPEWTVVVAVSSVGIHCIDPVRCALRIHFRNRSGH